MRSATYRVERPTSVFASGALSSARTRWELKEQPGAPFANSCEEIVLRKVVSNYQI